MTFARRGIDRLPPMSPEYWSEAQRREAQAMISGPRGAVVGPFVPLLRSPELAGHVQRLGEYLRYRSAIGHRLTELAILITAAAHHQPVEWAIHAPIAAKAGISEAAITAIERGERPTMMSEDDSIVHDFCTELHCDQAISDFTWCATVARWGEQGAVDLLAVNGYYSLLAMVMNGACTTLLD